MDGLVTNLNNHTPFSDGAYSIDELCEAHLMLRDVRVAGIGIADNLFRTPTSREPADEHDFERIFGKETRDYLRTLAQARARWDGRLRIYSGATVSWPLNRSMLDAVRNMSAGLDYILFTHVDWAGLTTLANQARRFPCPVGLAATDVSVRFPTTSQEQVVRTLANARIFFELNALHMPVPDFDPWFRLLPNHRVLVSLGTDTQDDLACLKLLRPMRDVLQRHNLLNKLIDPAPKVREALTA